MKKVFSIILSVIFGICLFVTLLLSVVRTNYSYSAITKILSGMMKPVAVNGGLRYDDGLFHPDEKVLTLAQYEDLGYGFDPSALKNLDLRQLDFTTMDVNKIVQSYLDAAGLDIEPEFIAEVLSSPEVSEFVDKYVGEVVDFMTGVSTDLNIDTSDIQNVVNKSIDMFEEHTGKTVDRTGLDESLEITVKTALPEITATLDAAKKENAESLEVLKQVEHYLSLKFFLIFVGVCVVLALLIFLINMNVFAWFKYVGMPSFVDGLLLFIAGCVAKAIVPGILTEVLKEAGLPGGVFEGIWSFVVVILSQIKIYGIVVALLGCALWVFGSTLNKKRIVKE